LKLIVKITSKALLLAFIELLFASNCHSQQVIWANTNNLDKQTNFTKVVGQNKYGVYVLKHKNLTFRRYYILEYFDHKMNLIKNKTFKIPGAELEKVVVHKDGILVFTKEYQKGRFHRLMMQSIDSNLNESSIETIFTHDEKDKKISDIRIEYNHDRTLLMAWYIEENGSNCKLKYHLISLSEPAKNGVSSIDTQLENIYVGDAIIDKTGNLYVFYTRSVRFSSKQASDFEHRLLSLNIENNLLKDVLLNNEKTFFSSYKLEFNPEFNSVYGFGLFGELNEEDNKGYFFIRIECLNQTILESKFTDFERILVNSIIGLKNEQKGENINKFKIKKLIPRTDGGILIICERIFITTQSDVFYVNGIPQSTYAKIYNNDEVMLLNLDSSGSVKWSDVINKNQSSSNDGGYYNSIIVMINNAQINILYNDRLSANADIIQVTYNENGEHSKKILINNEQFYAKVIPIESNQVSANSIVLPINQNRDFTYIKLLY
jgi:hypothetical protein